MRMKWKKKHQNSPISQVQLRLRRKNWLGDVGFANVPKFFLQIIGLLSGNTPSAHGTRQKLLTAKPPSFVKALGATGWANTSELIIPDSEQKEMMIEKTSWIFIVLPCSTFFGDPKKSGLRFVYSVNCMDFFSGRNSQSRPYGRYLRVHPNNTQNGNRDDKTELDNDETKLLCVWLP